MAVYRSPDTITLDVHAQSIKTPVFFVTGDVNAYPLLFKIVDGGVNKYDLTDKSVAIVCKVPNSTTPIVDSLTITDPTEGSCSYTVKNSIYANAGEIQAEIHIFDSEQNRLSTCTFYMTVRQGIDDSAGIEASDNYPILVQLIAQVQGNRTGKLQYTIACSDSVNKDRADLVLTGVVDANGNTLDISAVNVALAALDTARGSDKTIPVRVDFLGGHISNINASIIIPQNFYIYGNGTTLNAKGYLEWVANNLSTINAFTGAIITTNPNYTGDTSLYYNYVKGFNFNVAMDSTVHRSASAVSLKRSDVIECTLNQVVGTTYGFNTMYGNIEKCNILSVSTSANGFMVTYGNIRYCTITSCNGLGIFITSQGEVEHCEIITLSSMCTGIQVSSGNVLDCIIDAIGVYSNGIQVMSSNAQKVCIVSGNILKADTPCAGITLQGITSYSIAVDNYIYGSQIIAITLSGTGTSAHNNFYGGTWHA